MNDFFSRSIFSFGHEFIFQQNGNRNYKLENCTVQLKANTFLILKEWDQIYPDIFYDRRYLKEMLKDVFGIKCLAASSVGGTPARNKAVQHQALHPVKLKFIRGK